MTSLNTTVFAGGLPIATIGSVVTPHGLPPHAGSVLLQGSVTVFAGGLPVVRAGDSASCGHVVGPGEFTVLVGG